MNKMTKNLSLMFSIVGLGAAVLRADQPATPPASAAATAGTNASGPKIQFETPVYDFGKVKSGDPVKYTYIFTNIGTEVLEVSHVQPSCGCTTAGDWTHKVEPGQTGTIPVQFNSANFNGPVFKTVAVTSNDKSQPSLGLQLKGTVWKPIEVNPQFAVMNISPDSESGATSTVRIVNNMEEPLTLSAPESNNKTFTAELKTTQPGKEFQLIITAAPPLATGNVQGQISLKTSSSNMPVINVTAWANVQPAITVMPPQVTLPAGPLTARLTPSVTIQNNGTNTLTLSEPAVNAKDVDVQINEVQPGHSFSATLTFPEGFEMPLGLPVELTIKSSNPHFAVIKVPITQTQRAPSPVVPVKPAPTAAINPPPAPRPANQ
jgi:uncharacterized protein DUF1573